MTITDQLKKIPFARTINASRRAWQIERRYKSIRDGYSRTHQHVEFTDLWARRGVDVAAQDRPLRVLFCGTDELQDFGGFVQALGKFSDLRLLRRENGEYGQCVDGVAWEQNASALATMLGRCEEEGWVPDVLMMQSMGYRFRVSDLRNLKKRYQFVLINIGMDERLAYRVGTIDGQELGISGLNPVVDLALVTVPEAVSWYAADGVPAKYFPLASSSDIYFPLDGVPKRFDVGFIGRAYGRRLDLAKKIESSGLSFHAYGPGWGTGVLGVEQNNEFYNSCRFVLGAGNIGYSKKLMNPKLRDFEVPLTGVPYVTNYTPELARLFSDGEEICLYRTETELVRMLVKLASEPELAAGIGRAGLLRALTDHRYEDRFEVLFGQLLRGVIDAEFVRGQDGAVY